MSESIVVAAMYKFLALPNYASLRFPTLRIMHAHAIKGTLLLAQEGINGTISGTPENMDIFMSWMMSEFQLKKGDVKYSYCDSHPFYRSKVKLKKEIVTLGLPQVDPTTLVGQYVEPPEWNTLISDPTTLVIDTRNDYEVAIGSFKGAVNPNTTSFREFPSFVKKHFNPQEHKKVAMFCTGGIRCEKASSFMLSEGYSEVYHLKGGILNYLENMPKEDSLWEGECFVFDNRVAVKADLTQGDYDQCHACRHPITSADRTSIHFKSGISCPYCYDNLPAKTRESAKERQRQIDLAKSRNLPNPLGLTRHAPTWMKS